MAYTVTQIVDMARDLYNGTGDSFFTESFIYNWMTDASNILARRANLIETTSTTAAVASTADYAYPTNVIAIKRVTYNGGKLQRITHREYDALTLSGTTSTQTGTPVFYTDYAGYISLFPIPDNTYTIKFFTYSNQPSIGVSTTLSIPEQFQLSLVDYILMNMYSKDKDFGAAQFYRDKWEMTIKEAIKYTKDKKKSDRFSTVESEDLLPVTILGAS